MSGAKIFPRRGIVEGFFGPPWTMAHRRALFEFGARRGMNTYLYAPKDDPYHRKLWRRTYPQKEWRQLLALIRQAQKYNIDFVYGFHPGESLYFGDDRAVRILLKKAQRFYDAGVRTFAVLFDDIPSRLSDARDRSAFKNSLARAEGTWMAQIITAQPASWGDIEWWICPSYYSEDALLERVFGKFEANFLETLTAHLPINVACFWTGPSVVSKTITLNHVGQIARRIQRPLLLWDNYPVNDLSMSDELHIGPLAGRDPRLPQIVYGYLNNPLLQPALGFIPLATCFDYAAHPDQYKPEASWKRIIERRFGAPAMPHWRAIRNFSLAGVKAKRRKRPLRIDPIDARRLKSALRYMRAHKKTKWAKELKPWTKQIENLID